MEVKNARNRRAACATWIERAADADVCLVHPLDLIVARNHIPQVAQDVCPTVYATAVSAYTAAARSDLIFRNTARGSVRCSVTYLRPPIRRLPVTNVTTSPAHDLYCIASKLRATTCPQIQEESGAVAGSRSVLARGASQHSGNLGCDSHVTRHLLADLSVTLRDRAKSNPRVYRKRWRVG